MRDGVPEDLLDQADVVFHLISTTKPGNRDVRKEFETNVIPTIGLLEACAVRGIRLVYFSSGGTVYGIPKYIPLDEGHETEPISAYGIQKLSIEKCIEYYGRMNGLDYSILRIANPYGRFQDPESQQGVIAVFMAHALAGEKIEIWGDGSSVRDYVYVDDVMDACCRLLEYHGDCHTFNIGSGTGHSLQQIVRMIEEDLGRAVDIRYLPSRRQDVPSNVLDCRLAGRELGWHPATELAEGIHRMHEMWESKRQ